MAALREHGVQLAEGDSPDVRRVLVPVVGYPGGEYDLTAVFVRTQQVDGGPKSLAALEATCCSLNRRRAQSRLAR